MRSITRICAKVAIACTAACLVPALPMLVFIAVLIRAALA